MIKYALFTCGHSYDMFELKLLNFVCVRPHPNKSKLNAPDAHGMDFPPGKQPM